MDHFIDCVLVRVSQFLEMVTANPAPAVAFIGVVCALFGTWYSVYRNRQINLRNKRVDVSIHCNLRFDATHEQKLKLRAGGDQKSIDAEVIARSYYARLWGLKSDQFDYYLADVVDIETFANWCFMTMKAFSERQEDSVGVIHGFGWGWREVGAPDHEVANPWFFELTVALEELGRFWRNTLDTAVPQQQAVAYPAFEAAVGRAMLLEMLDVLEIVHSRSKDYRKRILTGMTISEYRNTLENQKALGLSMAARSSKIQAKLAGLLSHARAD